MRRLNKILATIFLVFVLVGCKEPLYKNLSEQEGNEMMALLMSQAIDCQKEYDDRSGKVTLLVSKGDISKAVTMLKQAGYPKAEFTNLGEVFSKESLISSPIEEHARYTYALSQDIAKTLSSVDGVLSARVHVVLPKKTNKNTEPPSAAVFIKHAPSIELDSFTPQIKMLVQASVEGLKYDDVSVALIAAIPSQTLGAPIASGKMVETVFGLKMSEDSVATLQTILAILSIVTIIAVLAMFNMAKKNLPQQLIAKESK